MHPVVDVLGPFVWFDLLLSPVLSLIPIAISLTMLCLLGQLQCDPESCHRAVLHSYNAGQVYVNL